MTVPDAVAVSTSQYQIMLHELGHVLGLDHDESLESIMWHAVQDRPGTLTDRDIERLNEAYS